jgi:RNase H-like domain found in reverse transcriptase/Reverse transcriptase (RNA-dependent DNA polymerase)/Integrase zinc binding domain/Retroviral aspartyl protease
LSGVSTKHTRASSSTANGNPFRAVRAINSASGCIVEIFVHNTNSICTFIIDTGSDISILKSEKLSEKQLIQNDSWCTITGVTSGQLKSIGLTNINLIVKNQLVVHNFQIVEKKFPICTDGIIGRDFIQKFKCIINYEENIISINLNSNLVRLPLLDQIIIPARSRVIRKLNLNLAEESIILSHEVVKGVLCANTIVGLDPHIEFLNVTENDIKLENFSPKLIPLANFKVSQLNKYVKSDSGDSSFDPKRAERLINELSLNNVPAFILEDVKSICTQYQDIFHLEGDVVSTNNFYKQKIATMDDSPSYIKNYRIPHAHKNIIEKEVQQLLKDGIIEPSVSPYNSPLLLVPKKGGTGRVVVDFRQVNKKIVGDKFPLPRIDEILDQLGRAKYFTVLDLKSGFHQIEIEEGSKEITSFSTATGHFHFNRLPFGLKISPNSFQRMMTVALAGLSPELSFLYIDDLVVLGCSVAHHLSNIGAIFERMRERNLKLNPKKCSFFQTSVSYLGHQITDKGIKPDPNKFDAIRNYPTPKNADEVRRFVAFCNYYRRFVPEFARKAAPLNRLLRKTVKFDWSLECENSFKEFKNALINPPILVYPDFEKEFHLTTDASDIACGAVLSQTYHGKELPIAYASKSFSHGEKNKSTILKELTAIHWAILYFRPYLTGKKFRVWCDHRPLVFLFGMKDPTSKLTRIRLDLEEFEFDIHYIKGKENVVADALSRMVVSSNDLKEIHILQVKTRSMNKQIQQPLKPILPRIESDQLKAYEVLNRAEVKNLLEVSFSLVKGQNLNRKSAIEIKDNFNLQNNISSTQVKIHWLNEDNFEDVLKLALAQVDKAVSKKNIMRVKTNMYEEIFSHVTVEKFKEIYNGYPRKLEILLYKAPVYLDNLEIINNLIKSYHVTPTGGHEGITKTVKRLSEKYRIGKVRQKVKFFVRTCEQCQVNKHTIKTKAPMQITSTPMKAADLVSIDTIGPFVKSILGNKYAITLQDDLTKFVEIIPIPSKDANTVARAIVEKYILTYGMITCIKTDMGTEYLNEVFREVCALLKINHAKATAYHPMSLGSVERNHKCLNEFLRSYINSNKDDWDIWVLYFKFCYNTTPTETSYSPFELTFGRQANLPMDIIKTNLQPVYNLENYAKEFKYRLKIAYDRAAKYLLDQKIKRKEVYDTKLNDVNFEIGDKVLLEAENRTKLEPVYLGPFEVIDLETVNVIIKGKNDKKQKVHKNRLILYRT